MRSIIHTLRKIATLLIISLVLVSFNRDKPKLDLVEKIYTQTDRPLYFPDETVWFKAYVVNKSNTISAMSEMMYADFISPKGSVIKTLRIPVRNGYSYGNFKIDKNWVGGIYTLKMYTNWMRNYGKDHFFTKEITVQKIVQPNLLMQLKFEKEGYGSASQVRADFEVKDLKNNPLSGKEVSMAVMVSGKSYVMQKLKTDEKGKLKPIFTLPDDLQSTDVLVNILIPHNGSTESISRSVPILLDNLDVQFFPESGQLIAGTSNTIAFKSLNEFGKPADISGRIVDETGNHISNFESYHDGMGGFEFEPTLGQTYFAQITAPITSERKIKLPEVAQNGVKFSIVEKKNTIALAVFSNIEEKLQVKVSNSSGELYRTAIPPNNNTVRVNTSEFPMGITKFSILDASEYILAERLVFINHEKQLNIDIQIEKETFDTREKVAIRLKTKDQNGKPVSSNVSIAVTDNKLLSFADDKQDHILSYLLLSSELRGKIHKPTFYFDTNEPKSKKALDYVMLTHGWRQYIKRNKVTLFNATYQPEQLSIQHGVVVDTAENPTRAHLLLFDNYNGRVLTLDTDDEGKFAFKLSGSNRFTLVAYTDDNKPLYIREKSRNRGLSSTAESKSGIPNPDAPEGFFGVNRPNTKPIKNEAKASLSLKEDASALDEVIVTAYGASLRKDITGSVSIVETDDWQPQENMATLLQGRAAGVHITQTSGVPGAETKINIRGMSTMSGNNQPLIIVDGIPRELQGQMDINPNQINSISVLKDLAATTLYGSRASNGVVLISTKKSSYSYHSKKKLNNKKLKNYTARSFYGNRGNSFDTPAKFYIPIYEGQELPEERTDFRPTIYWNPVVQTNAQGEANFEFYNSDAVTSFNITAEGVGSNGLLGRSEKNYNTKRMLTVDFKMPNYMSIGDIIELPLTINNESDQTLFSTLEVHLPKNIELIEKIDKMVTIEAGTTLMKSIRVLAKTKGSDIRIRVAVKSKAYQDVVHKEVTVVSPYFPVETSISGTESQNFKFNVGRVVPNSLSAEFNLYTDIVGDVTSGITSMIRQPYGCFEQVSSTTYPNILILKYLRETGKNKRRIERKAQKFIAEGYQKMAAYETEENGFEWYGDTPPHEALTAYGLMQFKEMATVYDGVDQKMIHRTVKWLQGRRDGKGGFLQNTGKYGFSSAPTDVNNAYIVYAISETDTKVDIEKEYRTAYFNALDSLDTYKLAITALTSHNLKKTSDYENLMSYLKLNIQNHGFGKLPVKNTITRSYGNAKKLETLAFTLLALMRDFETNELLIQKGIKHLVRSRAYGRFGSTQSTAMSLKALITYTKFQKRKIIGKDNIVELQLNGKLVRTYLNTSSNGKIRIDSLEKYIGEGTQTLHIKFNNPEVSFPYDMNIRWDSDLPDSSSNCKIALKTEIVPKSYRVGDVVRMKISVKNKEPNGLPMTTAIIGIPSGASAQPWQLKELLEKKEFAYYEVFDNYLVLYWREMGPNETKTINLDLKAEVAGNYTAPASNAYLYYGDEFKHWIKGSILTISE